MYWLSLLVLLVSVGFLWRQACKACEAANTTDWGGRWLNRLDGLNRLFCRYYHRFHYDPIPLPEHGPALLVSNHISGLDALLLIAASPRPLRFMIAREEYQRFGLNWLFRRVRFIPVERGSRPAMALREALRALQAGEVIAMFPQGAIQLDTDPPHRLKGGVVKLAQLANCSIYPVHLDGVAGRGRVMQAVVRRSQQTRLTCCQPLNCTGRDSHDCLTQLTQSLKAC